MRRSELLKEVIRGVECRGGVVQTLPIKRLTSLADPQHFEISLLWLTEILLRDRLLVRI